jgi:5'-nucleotidase
MKKILITNDDGVYSSGIHAAYEAIKDLGKIYVVAPATQKSGVGRALSIFEPIRVFKTRVNGIDAYAVGGTPTDSVIIGIYAVIQEIPDLIISGINFGENLSTEAITTSGTVGAALEGATQGSPSIAISMEVEDQTEKFHLGFIKKDFAVPIKILRQLARKVLKQKLPDGVDILNVNIPKGVRGDTPVKITRLARRVFTTSVDKRLDPRGRPYYWIDGTEFGGAEEGTDVHALKNGFISVTPITLDCTARIDLRILNQWMEVD